jgi:hypothetical protein
MSPSATDKQEKEKKEGREKQTRNEMKSKKAKPLIAHVMPPTNRDTKY